MPSQVVCHAPTLASDAPGARVAFAENRFLIVAAIAALPPEAFNYVCETLLDAAAAADILRPDSRTALEAIGRLVVVYLDSTAPRV